jgi:hypothetical protein
MMNFYTHSQRLTFLLIGVLLVLSSKESVRADSDLEETYAISKLELLNVLPWWKGVGNATRGLEATYVDETSFESLSQKKTDQAYGIALPEEVVKGHEQKHFSTTNMMRGTAQTQSTTTSSGFCLPPTVTSTSSIASCRAINNTCSSKSPCCSGLACRFGKCQAACRGRGQSCSIDQNCCSKQCVTCTSACQGRCGLGATGPNDDIQVRAALPNTVPKSSTQTLICFIRTDFLLSVVRVQTSGWLLATLGA